MTRYSIQGEDGRWWDGIGWNHNATMAVRYESHTEATLIGMRFPHDLWSVVAVHGD